MPHGLQCWNAAGLKTLDTTDRVGQMLGRRDLAAGYAAGTISDPNFAFGDPWWILLPSANPTSNTPWYVKYPTVTIGTNSLIYTTGDPCAILYGIY
jgi:hypothetical protein